VVVRSSFEQDDVVPLSFDTQTGSHASCGNKRF
jgi:hypothetical protein